MHLTLEVKKYHEFFWLRDIQDVNISQCCAKCFIGHKDNRVYEQTYHRAHEVVELDVIERKEALAYYLCGLSAGYNWYQNTHVAFIPAPGERVEVDNQNIHLMITDAKRIDFFQYKPDPPGFYTRRQRTCRNWIFANYVRDGMLETGRPATREPVQLSLYDLMKQEDNDYGFERKDRVG